MTCSAHGTNDNGIDTYVFPSRDRQAIPNVSLVYEAVDSVKGISSFSIKTYLASCDVLWLCAFPCFIRISRNDAK